MTTFVNSGQTLLILAGEASSGIDVLEGGFLDVLSGGPAVNTLTRGNMNVESGGTASNTDIAAGVTVVSSGGIADSVTVSFTGTLVDFGMAS